MAFFFDHLGVIEASHPDRARDPEADAIEAGAQNVEALEAEEVPEGSVGARFLTDPKDLAAVSRWLTQAGWKPTASEMRYVAKNRVELPAAHRADVERFLTEIDDHDDVHRVYAAL
jgi:transcriptional/translational regulatory protein YebC/TACO1